MIGLHFGCHGYKLLNKQQKMHSDPELEFVSKADLSFCYDMHEATYILRQTDASYYLQHTLACRDFFCLVSPLNPIGFERG